MKKLNFLAALVATSMVAGAACGQMNSDVFFSGSNNFGETGPTYLAAEGCGITTPTTVASLGFPDMQLILIANGTDDNGAVRLSQSADETTILAGNSVACVDPNTGIHTGNSYYREFNVSATGDLNLTSIEMGLEAITENIDGLGSDMDGLVPLQICLYYDTPITSIAHSGVNGPSGFDETFCSTVAGDGSQDLTVVTFPISATVPAGTNTLVVEIFTPGSDTDPATDFCLNNSKGCDFEIGDANEDGSVDLLDVSAFVSLVTSGGFLCQADVNDDGVVNLLDVGPFVDILTGG